MRTTTAISALRVAQLERGGLLRRMRVVRSGVYFQLGQLLLAECVVRDHPAHCCFDDSLRVLYPFGIRQEDWANDIPKLVQVGFPK